MVRIFRIEHASTGKGRFTMIYITIIVCSVLGIVLGMNLPTISYSYSGYLAIAIVAALDSVFGGINSLLNKKFDIRIFVSGFFGNAILAMLLTYLGEKLNVDIYLAAVIVFVGRKIRQTARFKKWFFGHYHDNRNVTKDELLLWEQIIRIS